MGCQCGQCFVARGRPRCKCFLKKDHEWNLEPLERIYGRFPTEDPLGRFAAVPNLGKPYVERENRLQYNQWNGNKSAHGPHRRDVTHILCKVSCFFFFCIIIFEILPFSQVTETIGFSPHTNPYISNVTQQCWCSPMLIFRAWATCAYTDSGRLPAAATDKH